jgi:large subunit ribosomal protein L1
MSRHGKKYLAAREKAPKKNVEVPVEKALEMVKSLAYAQFDESVDVHVNLGIDSSKGEQVVRGSVVLPHGRGKVSRVLVFAKGEHADAAQKAGADYVGLEDLVEKIKGGWLEFEYAVATPDLMGAIGQLAKFLGPRGLLPNKKLGTVTFDVAAVVKELKKGRVFYKNDKNGLVHFSFGKRAFDVTKLQENLAEFVRALLASKPASSKGKFLKKMTVSSTMGVGIQVNPDEVVRS